MTVFEAYSKLWTYFKENDSFIMKDDYTKMDKISETPTRDRGAVQAALDDWVKSELLTVQEQPEWGSDKSDLKKIYILKKPLDSNEQSIAVHPNLATYVMTEINSFCELIEDRTDWCDPMDLGSKDILNLIHILNFYKSKYKDSIGMDDDDDDDKKMG